MPCVRPPLPQLWQRLSLVLPPLHSVLHTFIFLIGKQWGRSEWWRVSPHRKAPLVGSGFGCVVHA